MTLPGPRAYRSSRFGPQDAASGLEVRIPPRLCQRLQAEPFHQLCNMAFTGPRTKTTIRFGHQDTTPGAEVTLPHRLYHLLQIQPHDLILQKSLTDYFHKS